MKIEKIAIKKENNKKSKDKQLKKPKKQTTVTIKL